MEAAHDRHGRPLSLCMPSRGRRGFTSAWISSTKERSTLSYFADAVGRSPGCRLISRVRSQAPTIRRSIGEGTDGWTFDGASYSIELR